MTVRKKRHLGRRRYTEILALPMYWKQIVLASPTIIPAHLVLLVLVSRAWYNHCVSPTLCSSDWRLVLLVPTQYLPLHDYLNTCCCVMFCRHSAVAPGWLDGAAEFAPSCFSFIFVRTVSCVHTRYAICFFQGNLFVSDSYYGGA